MSEEIYCAKCHAKTDEALLLSCDHNLCIPCAAENISRMESQGINKTQLVICDLCKSQTEIDNETSKEILSIAMNINNNLIDNQPNSISNQNFYNSSNDFLNISGSVPRYTTPYTQGQREICQEHGEEISYLCMDCMSKCICSECVVHGVHRNHEVINIKKAYPLIYDKAQELVAHVDGKIKELAEADNAIEVKKGELNGLNEKCKREVKNAFDEIRIKLEKKEKELIEKTETIINDNIQELNTYSRIINSKIISLNKIVDSIQAKLIRKNDLSLINFYCENKNKILTNSQVTELNNIPDLNLISNLKVNIDQNAFNNIINALNSLNFGITSMKGIAINKTINPQEFSARRNMYGVSQNNQSQMISRSIGINNSI